MGHKTWVRSKISNHKVIIPLIAILLILSSHHVFLIDVAKGGSFPGYTVSGLVRNIDGVAIKYANVSVENTRTGDILFTDTDLIGRYIVDIANFPLGYLVGDTIFSSAFKNGLRGNNTDEVFLDRTSTIINITIEDVLGPELYNSSCIGNRSDEALTFSADVSDHIEVTEVELSYLIPSETEFLTRAMALFSGNSSKGTWTVEISDIEMPGTIYFYFTAKDSTGNSNITSIISKDISHGNPHSFSIFSPASTVAGEEIGITVNILDRYGNRVVNYSREVVLRTSDSYYPNGEIDSHIFSISDNGSYLFSQIRLFKTSLQWLKVEEKDNTSINGSSMVLVTSGMPDSLMLVPGNSTILAGDPRPYVLMLYDEFSNPASADVDIEFSLSSDSISGTFLPQSKAMIPYGESQAMFFYTDTIPSLPDTSTITAQNPLLGSADALVKVIPSNRSHWSITPNFHSSIVNERILLSIQLVDPSGNPINVNTTTDIHLMSSSETGIFLSNDSVVETISIAPDDNILNLYYLDNVSHNVPTVIWINNGSFYGDGLSIINISSANVTNIHLMAETDTYIAGQKIDLTLYAFDDHGNLVVPSQHTFLVSSTDAQTSVQAVNSTGGLAEIFEYTVYTSGPQSISVKVLDEDIFSNITLNILSDVIDKLRMSTMNYVNAGEPFSCVVSISDKYNNTVMNYSGEIEFFSDDDYPATLPPPYIYSIQDRGSHLFKDSFILYITPRKNLTALASNENITITQELSIFDNSRPQAYFAYIPDLAANMDKMIFNLQVYDNIRIEDVKIHYSFDNQTYSHIDMTQISGNYSTGIGNYSTVLNISTTGALHVYFSVSDGSNIVEVNGPMDVPYVFSVSHDDYKMIVYIIVFVLLTCIIASVLFLGIHKS